jgi:hypothetical protein
MKGPDHIDGDYIDALTAKARRFERRWRNAPQQRDNGPEPDAEARTIAYSKVKPEAVEWLWPGRIPLGMLTLLIGDPGLGKSLLTLKLAAELSGTADALILSAEDSHAVTIRPRLEALEADLERVHRVEVRRDGLEEGIALPDDAATLDRLVAERGVRLSHLPEAVNSWRDQSVRRALAPLHRLAEERRCAVLVVAHLNKARGADPLYRAGGSIGIPAAVRSALLLARDPDDPDGERGGQRVLAHIKCNVAEQAESLAARIEAVQLDGDEQLVVPRFTVTGISATSAADLLERPMGEERTERDEAADFLRAELAGGPQPVNELMRNAPCSAITLRRAKTALGVKAAKDGLTGPWKWSLPEDDHPEDDHPHIPAVSIFDGKAKTRRKRGVRAPKMITLQIVITFGRRPLKCALPPMRMKPSWSVRGRSSGRGREHYGCERYP